MVEMVDNVAESPRQSTHQQTPYHKTYPRPYDVLFMNEKK
jgi:hypothetical protein